MIPIQKQKIPPISDLPNRWQKSFISVWKRIEKRNAYIRTLQKEHDAFMSIGKFDKAEKRRYAIYWTNICIKMMFRAWENKVEKWIRKKPDLPM
jgi:hypothetical protein